MFDSYFSYLEIWQSWDTFLDQRIRKSEYMNLHTDTLLVSRYIQYVSPAHKLKIIQYNNTIQ